MDLVKLHNQTRELLEALADRLPADRLAGYRSLSAAGEWAELVDLVGASLVKRQIPVTPAERDQLAEVLAQFPPNPEYRYLSDPDLLTKLTIA
ncbi:hypothetical protein ACOBQX_05635 [Actinokineospora sp. G85]|uniref:hypothetical protein n=1 Tax=Actinokineospora sp. G85 TaxID=3406626 RepID=UPI003C727CAF